MVSIKKIMQTTYNNDDQNINTNTQAEYTVSEISALIKKSIEHNFEYVKVRGEVSGLKIAPSGHVYFSLKDNGAVLSAVCWRGQWSAIKHKPQEGLEMICSGMLTAYSGQSKYQMVVRSSSPAGIGALMALLEKRKKQFQQEGLFDSSHKKEIPFLPKIVGVVTSPTGAVIQDIIHRIEDRFPMPILLWPVLVQGEQAAKQIAEAIYGFNKYSVKPDVLIVARGGGSIEDLWAFNEEIVVRAAFASEIPIISAVGHETDTTLIDYVADRRAPTPTAAAEMTVPVRNELMMAINDLKRRQELAALNYLDNRKSALVSTKATMANLALVIANYVQKLDEVSFRLMESSSRYRDNLSNQLEVFKKTLNVNVLTMLVEGKERELTSLTKLLCSYDYKNVLKRGFALVRDKNNKILKSVKQIIESKNVVIEMHDGNITTPITPEKSDSETQ
ncbi:MAG: exodeoxyribonuclease VII large subunit [Rickettsiales bacterium]|nr:exodeoxyribonuclease VII large subunit [Rickettsiales bacterium]